MPAAKLSVTNVGPDCWQVQWWQDGKVIDNVFTYDKPPKVRETTDAKGNTVLLTAENVEVGRYNIEWAGEEVPCGDSHDPNPVPESEWVTD